MNNYTQQIGQIDRFSQNRIDKLFREQLLWFLNPLDKVI
jgi:hypothetical protein